MESWKIILFHQLARRVGLEVAGVAFVGVDVDFELEAVVHAHEQFIERDGAGAADLQVHLVTRFHAMVVRVRRVHVDMAQRADDAVRHLKKSSRPHEHPTESALDVAGSAKRQIKAERDAVRVGEFDLVQSPAGTEDAEIGDHAAAWADERHGLLRGELSFLIQPLVNLELMTLAEERLDGLLREVAMARADVHDKRCGRRGGARQRFAEAGIDGLAHEVFDHGAVRRR